MKFRTEVNIENSSKKIEVEDQIFSIGSCFSTEISDLLKTGQIQTFNNPFGSRASIVGEPTCADEYHVTSFANGLIIIFINL